jgi:hypothetical protein
MKKLGLVVALASVLAGSCKYVDAISNATDEVAGMSCSALKSGDLSSVELTGNAQGQAKVRAFIKAVHALHATATGMENTLYAACRDIAKASGKKRELKQIDAQDKESLGLEGNKTKRTCELAISALATANVQVEVAYVAPKCTLAVDPVLECLASCGNVVEPGKLAASCEGGELSAQCEGKCQGTCEGKAAFACEGTCSAQCSGSCSGGFKGQCGGQCSGACDGAAMARAGSCAGVCEGSCDVNASGTCTAECRGECSGSCESSAQVQCDGACKGGCEGTMKAPQCTGQFKPPVVDASCHAACVGAATAEVVCEKPQFEAGVSGGSKDLRQALRKHVPLVMTAVRVNAERALASAQAVVDAGASIQGSLGDVGGDAVSCLTAGIALAGSATVNIKGSIEISGKAKGYAGTSTP